MLAFYERFENLNDDDLDAITGITYEYMCEREDLENENVDKTFEDTSKTCDDGFEAAYQGLQEALEMLNITDGAEYTLNIGY